MKTPLDNTDLISVTRRTKSSAAVNTRDNSEGIFWDIPTSGADTNLHEWIWQIGGKVFMDLAAEGDGNGGITNSALNFHGNMVNEVDFFFIGKITDPFVDATAALASPVVPGNVDNGSYTYAISFITAAGNETLRSVGSNSVTVIDKTVNGQIVLTDIPLSSNPSVTGRKIYRDNGGGYKLVTTIADNSTTTFTDNIATASLPGNPPSGVNSTGILEIQGDFDVDEGDISVSEGNIQVGGPAGSSASKVIALHNSATPPGTSVDTVHLFATDISAGNASLGLVTEKAVAVDAAVVSTHSLTIKINGTDFRLLLAT
jgi:hypothetical protein